VEIPLLYETGSDSLFDAVVVVTAPEDLRAARRPGWPVAQRSGRLIPDDEKVRRADFAYVNDGSLDELEAFVERVLEELRA
jgi:dephospho-CoA kinase